MTKYLAILGIIGVIVGFILFYKFAKKSGIDSEVIKQQEQQIEIKNNVIETKNFQQKLINKTSNITDLNARRQWLQLVFEERAANS